MLYRLWFRDGVGHPLTLTGFKLVRDDAGFDVWKDTTTLFTHVLRGHVEVGDDDGAELVGLRRPAHPHARLRQAADDVPGRRAERRRAARRAASSSAWIFISQLAEAYLRKRPLTHVASARRSGSKAASEAARSSRPGAPTCSASSPAAPCSPCSAPS